MGAVVWLASYPKSGSTWLRILLANYLRDGEQPVDINDLGGAFVSASSRRTFDEWVGVEASALDQSTVDRLRPEVYRRMSAHATDEPYVKVHDAWQTGEDGSPMFPPDVTVVAVYIARNPLDVAVSFASHWDLELSEAVQRMGDRGFCLARADATLPDQLRQFLGSWSGHVCSWLDDCSLPVHLVRYEDLRRDPERVFGDVVRACGLPDDRTRVRRAVAFSDFAELARQERERGFQERPARARDSFFRAGRPGAWREQLPVDLAERVRDAHGATMRRLGY